MGLFGPMSKPKGVDKFDYDAGPVNLVIVDALPSEPITVCYTADYSRAVEFGSNGRPGRRFVALAVQQWPRVVFETAVRAMEKTASSGRPGAGTAPK